MRHSPCFLFLLCVFSLYGEETKIEVLFSPKGGCTEAIVSQISKAEQTIYVQAYSFTSIPIAQALIAAHKRGIRIQIQVDKGQKGSAYTAADDTLQAGIPTFLDPAHAIAHNKIMIIDEKIVITGSFNFTKNAEESNSENLLIIHNQEVSKRYLDNWKKHAEHCQPFPLIEVKVKAENPLPVPILTHKYLASKNSQVFHSPDCPSVKQIFEKNLIEFNSFQEASEGRHPCSQCKPTGP